ncbi:SH2 domain-containing protein 7 [Centropristis striata]|uniref:SH2 domain-containing protein 7 n=1 Tax=Centropristis striata TaxID=184440 RepID=UPI0027DF1C8A|nr:SH2 domain-containing protein 7 [Centropristis striata]
MSGVDLHMEPSEGGLKELVLRWFNDTQAPLILNNGNFPDWFQGFTARKDTEDLLRDKALGCFLIRLSDKAVGYILSYRGHDRCRHFVITQNPDGQFVITGDSQTHGSLTELIQHYKVSPIQPFGEYLTSSCHEVNTGELYDVVNFTDKGKTGVNVRALRSLWDKKQNDNSIPVNDQRVQQQNEASAAPRPAVPPKIKSRKLTGAVSVDTVSLSQVVPPVPKRGIPLSFSLSGSLPDTSSPPDGTLSDPNRSQRLRGNTNSIVVSDRDSFNSDMSYPGDLCAAGTTYSELTLVENRSRSLPRLNNISMDDQEDQEDVEEDEYSNRLTASFTASYSPVPLKKVTCHTYSLHDPRDSPRPSSSQSEQPEDEMSRLNPLYQTSERPRGSPAQQGDNMYAEVPQRPPPAALPDNTYEQIPEAPARTGNTYETLEDVKTKKSKTTWGKNNIAWKKFRPECRGSLCAAHTLPEEKKKKKLRKYGFQTDSRWKSEIQQIAFIFNQI